MIAATCYTLRDQLKDLDSARLTLTRLRDAGCTAVQISGFFHLDSGQVAGLLRELGLQAAGAHLQFEYLRDQFEEAVADLQSWGATDVSVPVLPADYRSAEAIPGFAVELNSLGARLKERGIRLTYHNHSLEFARDGARTWLEVLFAETDPKLVQAELDTYWVQHGGGDPAAWIERLSGRIPMLHVKDMGIQDLMKQVDLPVGDGNLDWDRIFAAARAAGVEWYVIEQDNPQGDPVDCVIRSLRFLREHLPA